MNDITRALTAHLSTGNVVELTESELKSLGAEFVILNGFACGRVLAVLPTAVPDVLQVSCIADGAMDALVTYDMDVRTGFVLAG